MMRRIGFVVILAVRMRFLREVGHLLVGVSNLGQISRTGSCVEVSQDGIVPRIVLEFGDPTFRIREVAESDRIGGTDLRASGFDGSVRYFEVCIIDLHFSAIIAAGKTGSLSER